MKQFKFHYEDSIGIVVLDEYNDDIMFVMSALTESGFSRIGLMATPKIEGVQP